MNSFWANAFAMILILISGACEMWDWALDSKKWNRGTNGLCPVIFPNICINPSNRSLAFIVSYFIFIFYLLYLIIWRLVLALYEDGLLWSVNEHTFYIIFSLSKHTRIQSTPIYYIVYNMKLKLMPKLNVYSVHLWTDQIIFVVRLFCYLLFDLRLNGDLI